jgi:CRISPR/Cas system-associated endonuclease Cas1
VNEVESESLSHVRKKLLAIEGHEGNRYFKEVFQTFPKEIRVENRLGFKAYDGLNNTFNLVYAVLKWKVH